MGNEKETAWYDKAAGRRQHKAENKAKFQVREEEKARRKDEKSKAKPASKAKTFSHKKSPAFKKKNSVSAHCTPMFSSVNLPEDSLQILNSFDQIVAQTRNMSGKQQTLLPGQIKKLSHQLTDDRSSRRVGYMNDASLISAYISYFMWWNLVRLTKLFSNLDRKSVV